MNREGEHVFPFITRTEKNNGLNDLVALQDRPVNKLNTISIGLDTQTVFYQPTEYYTGQNIQVLSIQNLNREIALFLIPLIKTQLENLSWGGTGATLSRLMAKRLLLPITKEGSPNWDYMEQYIVNIVANARIPELEAVTPTLIKLDSVNWLPISIAELFTTRRGNSGPKNNLSVGDTVLIAARKVENGLDSLVTPPKTSTIYSDVITVNNNGDGGAGIAFYHPYEFIATQDVTVLIPKNSMTSICKLFIAISITNQREGMGFGFGNKLNSKRLEKLKIMLPVTEDNHLNWKFMEDYIKSLSNSNLI